MVVGYYGFFFGLMWGDSVFVFLVFLVSGGRKKFREIGGGGVDWGGIVIRKGFCSLFISG